MFIIGTGNAIESLFNQTYETNLTESESRMGGRNDSELSFIFTDPSNDVEFTDVRLEDYTPNKGFDIKNITSELINNNLRLNLTLYEYDVEGDIFYQMQAADAEVIFHKGEGIITYSDETSDFSVSLNGNTISALIDLNKLNYDTFLISGSAYREDQNESYGDYVISDDVDSDHTNELNELNLSYSDPKDDVKIYYILYSQVDTASEVDLLSTEINDKGNFLKITIICRGAIQAGKGYTYTLIFGNARFEYKAGFGSLNYLTTTDDNPEFQVFNTSLIITLDKSKLIYPPYYFEVKSDYKVNGQDSYKDEMNQLVPNYLHHIGEQLNLTVSIFEEDQIVMTLHGNLKPVYSEAVRSIIDGIVDIGNNNGVVEATEYERFLEELKQDFTTSDFFEFFPYVDSLPGQASIDFKFENVLGSLDSSQSVSQTIIGKWDFNLVENVKHNILFQFLSNHEQERIGKYYIFDFSYDIVAFSISPEYKYWEITPDASYQDKIRNYINAEKTTIEFPTFYYYIFKNEIDSDQFGFTITYNETLAKQDSDKDKPKDDGFIPGLEASCIFIAIAWSIIYLKLKKIR